METIIKINENEFIFRGNNKIVISDTLNVKNVGDSLNKIVRADFKVCLNDKFTFEYGCPIQVNDSEYNRDYIITSIILHVFDTVAYFIDYNKFESPSNYSDFSGDFGYDDAGKVFEIIGEFKNVYEALNNTILLDEEFLSNMREIYSDGDGELYKKNLQIKG